MTKPRVLALGVASAGLVAALAAVSAGGAARWLLAWIAMACAVASAAYLVNQPAWLGKRNGRLVWWRILPLAPYVLAYAIACRVRRARRRYASWNEVAPGLVVGARVSAAELPHGIGTVVDLTAEISAPEDVRRLPGYRSLPVLDGAFPPDEERFLALLEELIDPPGGVYIHCVSGRGRAPSAAAALLIARGVASDADSAFEIVRKGRNASAPTATDVRFVERIAARLR
jgi:protein-tyrosine phosphatase